MSVAAPAQPGRLARLLKRQPSSVADPVVAPDTSAKPDPERLLRRLDWQVVRRLEGLLQGGYWSAFMGQGLDLADIREYQPGDDTRAMEWNVTARTGVAHVRQYHEDREISVWLLLDTSASLDFGTARCRKADLLLEFSTVIARLLTRHGNRLGAMLFASGAGQVIPARAGRDQTLILMQQLLRRDGQHGTGPTNLASALEGAARLIRRRSLVFVVSDFIATPGWAPALQRLAQRHEVVAVWLRDPREEELPDVGQIVLEDAETGEQLEVDTHDRGFRARFAEQAERRRLQLAQTFSSCRVMLLPLSTDSAMLEDLTRFIAARKRVRGAAGAMGAPIASPPRQALVTS